MPLAAQPAKVDTSTAAGRAFVRLYNFDFEGAHAIADREIRQQPDDPMPYAVKAAAYLFSELDRLKILQIAFFSDDDSVAGRKRLPADPKTRAEFQRMIAAARERANARLGAKPGDREALFTLSMCSGLVLDYAALVERRRLGIFPLARQTQALSQRLLALNPPYYDAHLTAGSVEYVIGSMPFFLRWFIRVDGIDGNKDKAVEHLMIVSTRGRYYGPFARILLSVIHLREKRPREAEKLLDGLVADFPENPLLRRELARVRVLVAKSTAP